MSEALKARCFDKDWKYTKSESTDIAKTFARVRRQQKEVEAAKPANVKPIRSARGAK